MSGAAWCSLNLAYHVQDAPEAVRLNRARVQAALSLPVVPWITAEQVHGQGVALIRESPVRTVTGEYAVVRGVDGLITTLVDQPLALFFADCVPLFFAGGGVVGVAHAGWRGTWQGIARQMIQLLTEGLGIPVEDLWVALGPAIGPCCYTVDAALWNAFRRRFGQVATPRPTVLDLRAANRELCLEMGVPSAQIEVCPDCTACQAERYFSHRREGYPTGRMAALIVQSLEGRQGSPLGLPNPLQG